MLAMTNAKMSQDVRARLISRMDTAKRPARTRCELVRGLHGLPGGRPANDTGVSGPALAATSPPIRPFAPDVGSLHSQPGRCWRRGILLPSVLLISALSQCS